MIHKELYQITNITCRHLAGEKFKMDNTYNLRK